MKIIILNMMVLALWLNGLNDILNNNDLKYVWIGIASVCGILVSVIISIYRYLTSSYVNFRVYLQMFGWLYFWLALGSIDGIDLLNVMLFIHEKNDIIYFVKSFTIKGTLLFVISFLLITIKNKYLKKGS